MSNFELVVSLGGRGENLLKQNIHDNEKIIVKLIGSFGEALIITAKRLYILKWGFMTGNTIGGRCMAFEFANITGLEIKKGLMTGTFEVLTPATQNAQKGYWGTGNNSALRSDNVITIQRKQFDAFQEATKIGREMINEFHSKKQEHRTDNSINDLEKLAALVKKGILTKKEFEAKKKQILGI